MEGKKHDKEKLRWDLLPFTEVEDEVKVLTLGAEKYGPNNWQAVPDGRNRYFSALMRHLTAWRRGEEIDPETNMSHLAHAACNIRFLQWLEKQTIASWNIKYETECHVCYGKGFVGKKQNTCNHCDGHGKVLKEQKND